MTTYSINLPLTEVLNLFAGWNCTVEAAWQPVRVTFEDQVTVERFLIWAEECEVEYSIVEESE